MRKDKRWHHVNTNCCCLVIMSIPSFEFVQLILALFNWNNPCVTSQILMQQVTYDTQRIMIHQILTIYSKM